ncbi:MAG TPA: 2-C-methyl-D-erythritol 4-phosphate cytidylyltransferase [Verrucomicrobiae bacterium]|nr:2-C-methyl-D-erythritol 4-phosphate cytidylyltransferase [Verrucomicrobiae bacterium]
MNAAILVAAGKSVRMGADKLWLEIAGRPVIAHTWKKFNDAKYIDETILVVRDGMQEKISELAQRFQFDKPFQIVIGGAERQDSVWNGLEVLSPKIEIVAIHDAARPCVSERLIEVTIAAARETGAAVAAQRVTDTIKESGDSQTISRTLDRSKLWSVQTPQTFRVEIIRRAIAAAREKNLIFTDDTAVCELISQPVRLVESATPNPKVTTPADLPLMETLLKQN